jgi:hypothetical protein
MLSRALKAIGTSSPQFQRVGDKEEEEEGSDNEFHCVFCNKGFIKKVITVAIVLSSFQSMSVVSLA